MVCVNITHSVAAQILGARFINTVKCGATPLTALTTVGSGARRRLTHVSPALVNNSRGAPDGYLASVECSQHPQALDTPSQLILLP